PSPGKRSKWFLTAWRSRFRRAGLDLPIPGRQVETCPTRLDRSLRIAIVPSDSVSGPLLIRSGIMSVPTAEQLTRKTCVPCEGGVPTLTPDEVSALIRNVQGWVVVEGGKKIRKEWTVKNFNAGIDFFNKV